MPVSESQVVEALRPVTDPELNRSIVDLGMVKGVTVDGGLVRVTVALTVAGCPLRAEIERRVTEALAPLDGVDRVEVDLTVMTPEELAVVRNQMQPGAAGAQPAHGHSPSTKPVPFMEPGSRTRVLAIASGKGGVGKSSVTVNLAIALRRRGHSVGILDSDVYGFSIPAMLGVTEEPTVLGQDFVVPPEAHGVKCISMGFFVEEDRAVIWRGPMLHKALHQFLTDIFWDEPDFLLVDMPPGTGDVAISMGQYLPKAEVYVVTTPQPAAQRVAQRTAGFAKSLNLSLRGVVENMSWFTGDDGKRYELFGSGGGDLLAQSLAVPLLGRVPLVPELREGGDVGRPVTVTDPDGEASRAFEALADEIEALGPSRVYRSELTIS